MWKFIVKCLENWNIGCRFVEIKNEKMGRKKREAGMSNHTLWIDDSLWESIDKSKTGKTRNAFINEAIIEKIDGKTLAEQKIIKIKKIVNQ